MGCYEQPAITAITPVMAAPITLSGDNRGGAEQVCGRSPRGPTQVENAPGDAGRSTLYMIDPEGRMYFGDSGERGNFKW